MEIIKQGAVNEVVCQRCNSVIRWDVHDLNWTHNEPNYYYFHCPVCGETVWVKSNDKLDREWIRLHN